MRVVFVYVIFIVQVWIFEEILFLKSCKRESLTENYVQCKYMVTSEDLITATEI